MDTIRSGYYQYCCINFDNVAASWVTRVSMPPLYFYILIWNQMGLSAGMCVWLQTLRCVHDSVWSDVSHLVLSCGKDCVMSLGGRTLLCLLLLCAGVEGGTLLKSGIFLRLEVSSCLDVGPFRTMPFIIFGTTSWNNMGPLQLCNAVSQFWELPLK